MRKLRNGNHVAPDVLGEKIADGGSMTNAPNQRRNQRNANR